MIIKPPTRYSPLCRENILYHIGTANIIIEPFNELQLNVASYNLRLHDVYFAEQISRGQAIFNPYSKASVNDFWGDPIAAESALEVFGSKVPEGISPEDKIIFLLPGQNILGCSEEFVGTFNVINFMLSARSTMGRILWQIVNDASWGDVGFFGRIAFLIKNQSNNWCTVLKVGECVAQIAFDEIDKVSGADYSGKGHYGIKIDEIGITSIKEEWRPEMLLPQLYKNSKVVFNG